MQELSKSTGQNIAQMQMSTFRPPLEPMKIRAILEHKEDDEI
jgi:hypothetical protein